MQTTEDFNDELQHRISLEDGLNPEECQMRCQDSAVYGRWRHWYRSRNIYGHSCKDSVTKRLRCECTDSPGLPQGCEEDLGAPYFPKGVPHSTDETVHKFCEPEGLEAMHGASTSAIAEMRPSPDKQLESALIASLARQMEHSNIERMAEDLFTFYVCVRWVPDARFVKLIQQELASHVIEPFLADEANISRVVDELYQSHKFTPLLCSKSMNIMAEVDPETKTHFRTFEKTVGSLIDFLNTSMSSTVGKRLKAVDEVFCGKTAMNSAACHRQIKLKQAGRASEEYFASGLWDSDIKTRGDLWDEMAQSFKAFEPNANTTWNEELTSWQSRFPYYSFIDKPEGMPGHLSPKSSERFMVCFGSRVSSEMHRRDGGRHIMTDQNKDGCHGWWQAQEAAKMLERMVKLWRPPTCQVVDMAQHMGKKLLSTFTRMNQKLFDALPGMLADEEIESQGHKVDSESHLGPFPDMQSVKLHDEEYVDGMRVVAVEKVKDPLGCSRSYFRASNVPDCDFVAYPGEFGTVKITDEKLAVVWDKDLSERHVFATPTQVRIMPHGWRSKRSGRVGVADAIAGVQRRSNLKKLFSSMLSGRYAGLEEMLRNSAAKWAVCPVAEDANLTELDDTLGVGGVFRDFDRSALSSMASYDKAVPGQTCKAFGKKGFEGCQSCDIAVLEADRFEEYFGMDGEKEEFMCPVKPPLPFTEQVAVLREKTGQCFLHMNAPQLRQYEWRDNGAHNAKRRNDKKSNEPRQEFELLKLLSQSSGEDGEEVTYARYCTIEELQTTPRFCEPPKLHNQWETTQEMAEDLAETVEGAFGVSSAAISDSVTAFQQRLSKELHQGESIEAAAPSGDTDLADDDPSAELGQDADEDMDNDLEELVDDEELLEGDLDDEAEKESDVVPDESLIGDTSVLPDLSGLTNLSMHDLMALTGSLQPNVSLPKVSLPNVSLSDALSRLPNVSLPNIALPNISLDDLISCNYSMRRVSLDKFLPTLPNMSMPNVSLPNVSVGKFLRSLKISASNLSLPNMPSISLNASLNLSLNQLRWLRNASSRQLRWLGKNSAWLKNQSMGRLLRMKYRSTAWLQRNNITLNASMARLRYIRSLKWIKRYNITFNSPMARLNWLRNHTASRLRWLRSGMMARLGWLKNQTKERLLRVHEAMWDRLTGARRFLASATMSGVARLTDGLPGAARRATTLEKQLFHHQSNIELLHALSFQEPMRQEDVVKEGIEYPEKEHYKRFVVSYPCSDFDPAMLFAVRRKWGSLALRLFREAYTRNSDELLVSQQQLHFKIRGEAKFFSNRFDDIDSRYFERVASMQLVDTTTGRAVKSNGPSCEFSYTWGTCVPHAFCEWDDEVSKCVLTDAWNSTGWESVEDRALNSMVGAGYRSDPEGKHLEDLMGLEVHMYCGRKADFGKSGGFAGTASFRDCVLSGVNANARLRAKQPWKEYFPEETVIVVSFDALPRQACRAEDPKHEEVLCADAEVDDRADSHLLDNDKVSKTGSGRYRGIRLGAGFPQGTPSEVVLHPEDLLEALEKLPKAEAETPEEATAHIAAGDGADDE